MIGVVRPAAFVAQIYKAFRVIPETLIYHPDARWGVYACNGCSWFPEGPWTPGCQQHDLDYHNGGTAADRLDADQRLREYFEAVGHPALGRAVFLALRVAGGRQFRWAESVRIRSDITLGKLNEKLDWAELARVRSMPAYLERWGRDNLETFLLANTPYGSHVPGSMIA